MATPSQQRAADEAGRLRSRRAALKRAIIDGRVDGFAILAGDGDPDQEDLAAQMTLEQLGLMLTGPRVLYPLMVEQRIPDDCRLYTLTRDRRGELARLLAAAKNEEAG